MFLLQQTEQKQHTNLQSLLNWNPYFSQDLGNPRTHRMLQISEPVSPVHFNWQQKFVLAFGALQHGPMKSVSLCSWGEGSAHCREVPGYQNSELWTVTATLLEGFVLSTRSAFLFKHSIRGSLKLFFQKYLYL